MERWKTKSRFPLSHGTDYDDAMIRKTNLLHLDSEWK